jgi:ABC-type phosphate transport system substrate-binding protein
MTTRSIASLLLRLVLATGLAAASLANADEMVVVMRIGSASLSKDQVANIYLGRDKGFRPVDLPEASPLREAFYKKATDRDLAQIRSVWARLTFTGENRPPHEVPDDAAVKKAVAAEPKAIGYISKASVDNTVQVVLELH